MRRSVIAVVLGFAVSLFLGTASATAAPPTRVVIDVTTDVETGTGTFVATGGIVCPSGTTSDDVVVREVGNLVTFNVAKTFACADGSGTFVLRIFAVVRPCDPFNRGVWRVADGTGSYAELSGFGQLIGSYLPDDSCTATSVDDHLTGRIQLG